MSLEAELSKHELAWEARPLVRRLYREWFAEIAERLSPVSGLTVELGSGIGRLRELVPELVTTDVEPTRWADRVADAEALPFEDRSLANLVLVDVYHHLRRPSRFLDEAARVLAPGGRVVMLEPYCSPVSTIAYRLLHHEQLDLHADGFAGKDLRGPLDANIAQTTLAFFRQAEELDRRWPTLRLRERRLLSLLVYPLSGGFSKRAFLPGFLYRPLSAAERFLAPLNRVAALRCLIMLERAAAADADRPGDLA